MIGFVCARRAGDCFLPILLFFRYAMYTACKAVVIDKLFTVSDVFILAGAAGASGKAGVV